MRAGTWRGKGKKAEASACRSISMLDISLAYVCPRKITFAFPPFIMGPVWEGWGMSRTWVWMTGMDVIKVARMGSVGGDGCGVGGGTRMRGKR